MRQQTTLNSSGWLSSFVRSSHVGALIALFFSIMLTACGSERTIISEEPGPDGVAPELTLVKIYNGFNKGSEVKLGQTIMVEIEASESIMKPTIIIDGVAATVSGQHHEWTAEYTMDDESREDGPVPFKISFVDVSGVSGVDVEVSTEGDPLQYCKEGCASGDAAPGIVGDWKLAPIAGALGVGPVQGDISWWSSSEITLVDRDCLWDDIFRFNADGSFENVMGDLTFTEDWQNGGQGEVCLAPVAPHDGSNAATYVHDEAALTLTLDGVGAHIGLPKAVNGAELASPGDAPSSIVYTIVSMNDTAMTLDINFGPGFWRFELVKEVTAQADPIVGDWKLAPVAGALGVGPVQGDISWWSSSEITLVDRDCLWDDIFRFNADGSFENVMGDLTFTEDWQNGGQGEVCIAPVAPHDGSNAATYVFDDGAYTLSLDGVGAHLGLPKAVNDAELTSPGDAPASIIYTVSAFNDSAMTLDINFGPGFWRFELVKVAGSGGAAASSDSILVGDWKMAPEAGALGVGPGQGDTSWWSNSATDLEDRACFFDDIFRFNADGSFENVMGDQTWLEAWQGVDADGCGALVAPHDGSNAATYNYIEAANTLKISGVGAHLGLAKVYNEAELSNPVDAPASISYTVTALNATEMTLDIEIQGGAYWRFKLVKI
jgi:hypothetical protein